MKHNTSWIKITVAALSSAFLLSNCVQTYDAYGRPVQTVDPGAALVGAAVIGAVAYSAGNNNRKSYRTHHYHHNNYYRSSRVHRRHW